MANPLIDFGFGRPGLVWGVDAIEGVARPTEDCSPDPPQGLRWLHLNLADEWTKKWIASCGALPGDIRDMLLSDDKDQRAIVDGQTIGFVVHDYERDFDERRLDRVGVMRFAVTPRLMLTTRLHPLQSADIAYRKLHNATALMDIGDALGVLLDSIADVAGGQVADVAAAASAAEDAFLDGHATESTREHLQMRRRAAAIHRQVGGLRNVLHRLERDARISATIAPVIARFAQRLDGLDADAVAVMTQLRQLREELDLEATQRTNKNLYLLSVMTAVILPATFVTGLFGMNTGGLPFVHSEAGSTIATLLSIGLAAVAYVALRMVLTRGSR